MLSTDPVPIASVHQLSTDRCPIHGCGRLIRLKWGFCPDHFWEWQISPEWDCFVERPEGIPFRMWRVYRRHFVQRLNCELRAAAAALSVAPANSR
jgi:hypothetical protein